MPGQLIHILAMFVDHFLGFWPFARDKTNVAASGPESSWLAGWLAGSALHMYQVRPAAAASSFSGHAKCIFQLLTRAAAPGYTRRESVIKAIAISDIFV